MNEKIASAKKFVTKHKAAIACTIGAAVGVAGTYVALTRRDVILALSDTDFENISSGGDARFKTDLGRIYVALHTYNPPE